MINDYYVGQHHLHKRLQAIQRTLEKGENLNILFSGRSGFGKTHIIKSLVYLLGLEKTMFYAVNEFNPRKRFHVYDECHKLTPELFLYDVMVSGKYSIFLATNYPGELKEALVNRCHFHLQLKPYTLSELATIAYIRSDSKIKFRDCIEIAKRSRFNPRTVGNIVKGVQILEHNHIDITLNSLGFMSGGYTEKDIQYLNTLKLSGGQASLNTLCGITGIDKKDIVENVEPFLIQKQKIQITARGRKLV